METVTLTTLLEKAQTLSTAEYMDYCNSIDVSPDMSITQHLDRCCNGIDEEDDEEDDEAENEIPYDLAEHNVFLREMQNSPICIDIHHPTGFWLDTVVVRNGHCL